MRIITLAEILSLAEYKIRPVITKLPPSIVTNIYSPARKAFIKLLTREIRSRTYIPPESESRILWGIRFNSGIFNAAGMFKHGEGYYTAASQGAGAYLAGTSTGAYRRGNERKGVIHPFMPYPRSGSASNWMGLPNEGHVSLAKKLSKIEKAEGCPLGVSVSDSPELPEMEAMKELVNGMGFFKSANVDFIELNESCPNIPQDKPKNNIGLDENLLNRLEYIGRNFIKRTGANPPVIVKLSNDTDMQLLPALLDVLTGLGFGGVNFGNTSTEYGNYASNINVDEKRLFDYFTTIFGGGLSGRLLKRRSYELSSFAASYIENHPPLNEFYIIRTGGIESLEDIRQSDEAGIALNQWFTGYFENFAKHGHSLYKHLFSKHN
ncbi:MAG: hypothetical protein A2X61_04990 [Ignavibacteria bacterium GWB2_35_12]|nr:MAG: hypothetical protein A2X63_11130 [Ignavibacteria bacterium GWA2_35_8]OGU41300.1 MAG: hypothetical protein A2X61_04990 [Ignavibacteria bacterium GWB2_35_12]OGU94608.1 MAG: hypothetical protein A2220_04160 [Ignavibacteria bacterium RIFOXYA2_FULL_35_10]OGV23945.1 MAG: hypothetical protein A2475_02780 [Ignavibacteria bacterium RIFOXYC2_FULL_35_21]